jgi:hypothetical protein
MESESKTFPCECPLPPTDCHYCGQLIPESCEKHAAKAVCKRCVEYVISGRCLDCKKQTSDCECPCKDCGEPLDDCYCHHLEEPIPPICASCNWDPCICETQLSQSEREEKDDYDARDDAGKRCVCGVVLSGYEGWGGYCSRDCASYEDDRD